MAHKAKGEICFGDLESTDEGMFWGYRFDGAGDCVELEGEITWKEAVF
jgi:hypothetical protein